MEPLICPQCGGQIIDYSPGQTFVTCEYCSTKVLIEPAKPQPVLKAGTSYEPDTVPDPNFTLIMGVMIGVIVLIVGGLLISYANARRTAKSLTSTSPAVSPAKSTPGPTPTPELLEFGGKGPGNGQFKDARSIAVDTQGRIYVADDSMRVQQFDDKGTFLKAWQIPPSGPNYERTNTIDKVAVGSDGKMYVGVGGVVLVYNETSARSARTIQFAPDYVEDFALRSDGSVLAVTSNGQIETLIYINKDGRATRRLRGFVTDAGHAALSPMDTGLAAIRIAVDGTGNIFSVYAFGDIGNYSMSFNKEELMIFRFTPEGKFVNKFVESMNSCGIEVDSKGRIYVSEGTALHTYTSTGEPAGTIEMGSHSTIVSMDASSHINAFALDKANNVYLIRNDKVIKRAAIE